MRHGRRKSKGMAHQPGYMETKACRILAHAEQYVRQEYGPTIAWAVLSQAYFDAMMARAVVVQRINESRRTA